MTLNRTNVFYFIGLVELVVKLFFIHLNDHDSLHVVLILVIGWTVLMESFSYAI